jgi:dihydrofolate reductase
MRRIVMFNLVTADGYFAGPDGSLDFFVPDKEFDKAAAQNTQGFDAVLLGRVTYQLFEAYWPHAGDDPATSPEDRTIAAWLGESRKIVFSRTLDSATWVNTELVRDLAPERIEELKREGGKDMIVFGSGSVVRQLTEWRLIDEYQFCISPVLLGRGKPLLGSTRGAGLDLLESRTFRSGNVFLRYALRASAGTEKAR